MISKLFVCLTVLSCVMSAEAADLKIGDTVPAFSAKDDTGAEWKSSEHFGKKIYVFYFYPADMTGGCTRQACGFRDDIASLRELGVEVIGVSGDTVENHQDFKAEKGLNFPLLADTEGKVATAFGVPFTPGEKSVTVEIGGKPKTLTRALTTKRWTFIVDQSGKVVYKDENVDAGADSQKIAAAIKKLKG
jgi:peroxiredoxin Q/BCP